nr:TPA_asm: ALTO [Cat associated lyon-IARC polyomavirus]
MARHNLELGGTASTMASSPMDLIREGVPQQETGGQEEQKSLMNNQAPQDPIYQPQDPKRGDPIYLEVQDIDLGARPKTPCSVMNPFLHQKKKQRTPQQNHNLITFPLHPRRNLPRLQPPPSPPMNPLLPQLQREIEKTKVLEEFLRQAHEEVFLQLHQSRKDTRRVMILLISLIVFLSFLATLLLAIRLTLAS